MEVSTTLAAVEAYWHPHAACADDGPDPYFIRRPTGRSCSACPAAEPRLWAAMAFEQIVGYRHGIWGGTTPARRTWIAVSLPHLDYPHLDYPHVDYRRVYLAVVDIWRPSASGVERPGVMRSGLAA